MFTKLLSYVLVFFQLLVIALIVGLEPAFCKTHYLLAIQILGIVLVVYAVWSMKKGNFNITPLPKEQGELRTSNFYKVVRHPMYLSTLITLLPLIIDYFSYERVLLYLGLIFILILKLNVEERLLIKQFPEYVEYQKKTWKLLPFVY